MQYTVILYKNGTYRFVQKQPMQTTSEHTQAAATTMTTIATLAATKTQARHFSIEHKHCR
jgi:TRAP-type C4-dicarboxylate transport system permease small subunit